MTARSGGNSSLTFTANNNHIDGYTYDAAGNLMSDGLHTYYYDAEHHLVQVDGSEGWCASGTGTAATSCYTYDAEGRRVRRTVPGSGITDDYLYDLDGHYITQVSGGGFWIRGEIYAGGRHLATYENDLGTPTTFFEHTDWLGTERVETAVNGTACETIQSVAFGDGLSTSGSCDPSAKYFTGKERDWESNLDNFGARYYSSQIGRFMSADWSATPAPVPYANFSNPQTLNLYAIVSDNPETFADLDGHEAAITAPTAGGGMDLTGVGSEVSGDLAGFDDNMGAPQYNSTPSENQNKAQQQNTASPLKDKNGNVVLGASGQPALIPSGFDVNAVVKAGKSDAKSLVHKAEDLANFRRGGKWDLQRLSGKFDPRFVDSATILIGMYAASADITRKHILTIENDVAIGGHYAKGTPMDSTYTHLPVRNVTNTDIGMRLVLSGAVP